MKSEAILFYCGPILYLPHIRAVCHTQFSNAYFVLSLYDEYANFAIIFKVAKCEGFNRFEFWWQTQDRHRRSFRSSYSSKLRNKAGKALVDDGLKKTQNQMVGKHVVIDDFSCWHKLSEWSYFAEFRNCPVKPMFLLQIVIFLPCSSWLDIYIIIVVADSANQSSAIFI